MGESSQSELPVRPNVAFQRVSTGAPSAIRRRKLSSTSTTSNRPVRAKSTTRVAVDVALNQQEVKRKFELVRILTADEAALHSYLTPEDRYLVVPSPATLPEVMLALVRAHLPPLPATAAWIRSLLWPERAERGRRAVA